MSRRRQFVFFWLRLVFGLSLLGIAFYLVDFRDVTSAVKKLNIVVFGLALLISAVGSIVIPAIITSRTLKVGEVSIGLWDLIKINFGMRFYVLTLPHVITVGIRWRRYRGPQQGKGWQIAALLLFERVSQFIVVVTLAFFFLIVSYPSLPAAYRPLIPVSGVLSVLGAMLFMMFVSPRFFAIIRPLIDALETLSPKVLAERLGRLVTAISDYQKLGNKDMVFVLAWTTTWHLLFVLSAFIVSMGLGIPLNYPDIGWMRSAVLLLTVLPITIGGLGVREVGFAMLLHFYGVDKFLALALPLVLLAIQLLLGAVGAMFEIGRAFSGIRR